MPKHLFLKGVFSDKSSEAARYSLYSLLIPVHDRARAPSSALLPAWREQEMLYDLLSRDFLPLFDTGASPDDEDLSYPKEYENLSFAVDDCVEQIKTIARDFAGYRVEGFITDQFVARELQSLRVLLSSLKDKMASSFLTPRVDLLQKAINIKAYALNCHLVLFTSFDEMRGQIGEGVYPVVLNMALDVLNILDGQLMSPGVSLVDARRLDSIDTNFRHFVADVVESQKEFLETDSSHKLYEFWRTLIENHFKDRIDAEAFPSPRLAETQF